VIGTRHDGGANRPRILAKIDREPVRGIDIQERPRRRPRLADCGTPCSHGRLCTRSERRIEPEVFRLRGSVDPGVILYLFQGLGLAASEVEAVLYKRSGLLAISGVSSDMRELLKSAESRARLAVDYFVYQAAKEIGALAAVLGGIDGLVFTAGIGENSAEIRSRIVQASAWLGIELDKDANAKAGLRISTRGSKVSAWVIPTNEELMIARHTGLLLSLAPACI
jgi:hypothetical protein